MTKTVEAVYENGVLKLPEPLPIPEKTQVTVTIHARLSDSERDAWLHVSEAKLANAWDDADDVFNELLEK
jgi:predicted DNA-binding antitoxin AbrB/MazE fold protein